MPVSSPVLVALNEWGAGAISHPGGTLFDHLVRTQAMLRSWCSSEDLALAGLCHAAYGTHGFDAALLSLQERPALCDLIGHEAEALVYLYASCDRVAVYPQLGRQDAVLFRDRFEQTSTELASTSLTEFAELTFANELDIVRHNPVSASQVGPPLAELFRRCRTLVTPSAYEAFEVLLDREFPAAEPR
jgi:hypothetical protein